VVANARRGDIDDVIAKVDQFAYEKSFLINVGDEKGELLDAAVRRANPGVALELGTYCGYGSLRIARAAPSAKVFSVELSAANAEVAEPSTHWPTNTASPPGNLTCCSSITTRVPTSPICGASSTVDGCTAGRSSSRTTF
jgi:hypothetical protein